MTLADEGTADTALDAASELLARLRAGASPLVESIADRVQREVPAYEGPATGRRHRLITLAAHGAATQYLERLQGRALSGKVDQLYRQMGYGEAVDGHAFETVRRAVQLGGRLAQSELRRIAVEQDATAATLGRLEEVLAAELEHLEKQLKTGHDAGRRSRERDPVVRRTELLDQLLEGAPETQVAETAELANWSLPEAVVLVSVQPRAGRPLPDLRDLPEQVLSKQRAETGVLLCAEQHLPLVIRRLDRERGLVRAAASWPVPPHEAPHALRWSRRALELARTGVIGETPYIDCAEHRTQLWLHSEPALRQRLVQELLPPLLAETPNSREILSETLLVWLETRDSAPAIAARLDVHPQTVRYRWKRINELFGDDLHDPDFVVQITMLLKASVPLWKAGDQSDFERFRTVERS